MKLLRIVLLIILCLLPAHGFTSDKLEIVWADSITSTMTTAGPVRVLNWNVHLRQEDADLYCDHVRLFEYKDEVILDRNVRYTDSEKSLKADKIIYDDVQRITHAIGRVSMVDSIHTLTAHEVFYYQQEQKVIADKNIVLTDNEQEVKLIGDHAEYRSDDQYAYVTGNPVLTKLDSNGVQELEITGKNMEVLNGGNEVIVTDSVRIVHKDGYATCQRAEFYKDNEYALLQQQPILIQRFDKLSGEEVKLYFSGQQLEQAVITKNALVLSPVDTLDPGGLMNRLKGEKITLDIKNRQLTKVLVEGQATSYYHVVEKNEYKGLNEVIGDKITMLLKDNTIQQIIFESDPGTSDGKYHPPDIALPQK